jgi:hypothetical protein
MSNESSETWTDAEVQRVAIDGAYDERMLAREALAARAEIARLRAEVERLTRLRAFDTSTVPLPPGLALEHERLDAMWRQLVAERDHARAIVAAADALREAIRPYAPDEARAYDAARGTAMSDAGTVLEHDPVRGVLAVSAELARQHRARDVVRRGAAPGARQRERRAARPRLVPTAPRPRDGAAESAVISGER